MLSFVWSYFVLWFDVFRFVCVLLFLSFFSLGGSMCCTFLVCAYSLPVAASLVAGLIANNCGATNFSIGENHC